MKKKKIAFTVLETLFVAVVPLVLVIVNYASWGQEAQAFKIAFTGILLAAVVLYAAKKILLNGYLERARQMLTQNKADLRIETDECKREKLIAAVKRGQTFETAINYLFPLLLLAGLYVLSQALETAAVKLSGTVGWIAVSMLIGFAFGLLAARKV